MAAFAFSPDGRRLAAALDGGSLLLCDAKTFADTQRLAEHNPWEIRLAMETGRKGPNQIRLLAFPPDSQWLASAGSDGGVYLWEAATGKEATILAQVNFAYDIFGRRVQTAAIIGTGGVTNWSAA